MEVRQIFDEKEKETVARHLLEQLQEWFGIPEAREEYIAESVGKDFFCAYEENTPIGFLYLKETGKATVELAAMGVLQAYHRKGVGKTLVQAAKAYAAAKGYSFMQVKTVQMGRYDSYDKTNLFYQSMGFQEFEVFPTLWDEWNPCQIYVMALK